MQSAERLFLVSSSFLEQQYSLECWEALLRERRSLLIMVRLQSRTNLKIDEYLPLPFKPIQDNSM
uniref:TIR domain-containing protein n=1 Tax=Heterorhabditis bacteriophora TaxID=37862 RepID=A0A1I7WAR6_HETBA